MRTQSAMPAGDAASAVIDVLSARVSDAPACEDGAAGLLGFLARVPDRRRARGRRHRLATILALACAAVAAGSKSLTAIAEWSAAAPTAALSAFGARRHPRSGELAVPSETTIRRTLARVDADALDEQVSAWLLSLAGYSTGGEAVNSSEMVIAVDGKTARGAKAAGGTAPHFLAVITCAETGASPPAPGAEEA